MTDTSHITQYRRRHVLVAEPADTGADGKEVRIVRDVEGSNADLYPEDKEDVALLREYQARRLRDSLDEVLD